MSTEPPLERLLDDPRDLRGEGEEQRAARPPVEPVDRIDAASHEVADDRQGDEAVARPASVDEHARRLRDGDEGVVAVEDRRGHRPPILDVVKLPSDAIRVEARGVNEIRDKLPVLTRVEVAYTLRIPPESRETVERALSRHQDKCPTAATLAGSVEVSWTADIREAET